VNESNFVRSGTVELRVSDIYEEIVSLRPVDKSSEEFQGLVESIRLQGLLSAITVRPIRLTADGERVEPGKEREDDQEIYGLVDGLHRLTALKEVGVPTVTCIVKECDDAQMLVAQVMANIHRIETRPAQYTAHLIRMIALDSTLTEATLAAKLGRSVQWLQDRLSLTKIKNTAILELINEGTICLANAFALAKLPEEEHVDWSARAQTMPPAEFLPQAAARQRELKTAARTGRQAVAEFTAVAHSRKMSEIKAEHANHEAAVNLVNDGMSPAEGFALGVAWVLHLDPASVQEQHDKWLATRAEQTEAKKKNQLERQKKKAENAQERADEANKEAENIIAESKGQPLPFPDIRTALLARAAAAEAKKEAAKTAASKVEATGEVETEAIG